MIERNAVLVVEPDDLVRDLLRDVLQSSGYAVFTARSVREALSALGAYEIDMVLSEHELNDGSGLEILRSLAKDGSPTRPAVFMTSDSAHAIVIQDTDLGVRATLHKPFRNDEILSAVEAALRTASHAVRPLKR